MSSKKSKFDDSSMETIINEDVDCKGKLFFKNDIIIKGKFEGEIETKNGHLYIEDSAEITSTSLKVKILSNKGKIIGNVESTESIRQYKGGIIEGDIVTPDLYIESGSKFNGNCTMIDNIFNNNLD